MKKLIIYFLLFNMFSLNALASDVQFKLERNLINLMDRTILTLEFIDCQGSAVELPKIEGLDIQYQGQSSETRIINMQRSSKNIHRYIVTPKQTGEFTIGPVSIEFSGTNKIIQTQLKVIEPKNNPETTKLDELIYAKIENNKDNPYVYESFELLLKIYLREGIQTDNKISIIGGLPGKGLDGEIEWEIINQEQQVLDGFIYTVSTLRSTIRTITAGTYTFKPNVQINLIVPRQNRRSFGFNDPFFGDFFGRQEKRSITVKCNELVIPVRQIPSTNKPESYTGGIGEFTFSASIKPTRVKAGEPVTLKSVIKGIGNLDKITSPVMPTNKFYKLYSPRIIPSADQNTIQFEQVIIPQSTEIQQIPSIEFSYFNIKDNSFNTLTAGPFNIEVSSGEVAHVLNESTIKPSNSILELSRDIVYLKPLPKNWKNPLKVKDLYTIKSIVTIIIPPTIWIILFFYLLKKKNIQSNPIKYKRNKAFQTALSEIKKAQKELDLNNLNVANEILHKAILIYFGLRLKIPSEEISRSAITNAFMEKEKEINKLLNLIEHHRYSPVSSSEQEMQECINLTKTLLQHIERLKR